MQWIFNHIVKPLVLSFWIVMVPDQGAAGPVEDQIEAMTMQLAESGNATIKGETLLVGSFIFDFYDQRQFSPVWFETPLEKELFAELSAGVKQGFRPEDFHLTVLPAARILAEQGDPADIARFEMLATDAAARLVKYSFFGKVNPEELDADWNFARPVVNSDPVEILTSYLAGDGFSALMDIVAIDNPQYALLLDALARYSAMAARGGWPELPSDEIIKPGMVSPVVALLRDRLAAEGELREATMLPEAIQLGTNPREIYDSALEIDVRAFQDRHGLEADGVIGGRTFVALNRTAVYRGDQLRLSLERARWLMRDVEGDFILVNIAGAQTYLIRADGTLWKTKSITGTQYRKTPVFRDEIKYMEFNPTWTVPRSIFIKDKLPVIRRDVGYLARNNYVVRAADGSIIPARSVNWSASNPNITLIQKPGPSNALGLVKFMFPNKYSVYLHDTNDRSLFDRNERNLSSGCVRLEQPFELAMLLMEGDPDWSYQRMQSILDSKKTTRINLSNPMPVLLTYWTAWAEGNIVHFREDIYERDGRILEALNK